MTWHKIFFEIPPKPGLQFIRDSNFNFSFTNSSLLICPPHHTEAKQSFHSLSLYNPNPRGFTMKGGRSKAEPKKADSKLSVKKKGAEKPAKQPAKKGKAAAKDPNKPKRPASAFFVFMEDFRKTYKEKHPNNKSVAAVGKAGGDKWKSMSEAEKAPFVSRAEKRKTEYNKNIEAYNKRIADGPAEDEESDKSMSEVHDDDDDESGEEEDDDE
ncbi:HMG1/2-like protein [Camellia sinensis]|nr:HMG1/2-like protein [Camellia sinensis]